MPTKQTGPLFEYFLAEKKAPITKSDACWAAHFPLQRQNLYSNDGGAHITYGDYFEGVREFLEKDHFRAITTAVSRCLAASIPPEDIETIHIHLEKHGPFYHPARIKIVVDQMVIQLVLNVAISAGGKRTISREYTLLKRLTTDYPYGFLPKVYYRGNVSLNRNDLNMGMFLGEWIDDHHEFHISEKLTDGRCNIMIWDPARGKVALASDQVKTVYQEAANILTCYYNPETFEQIFPWYHSAGDFILKLQGDTLDMKLITVREYGPMIQSDDIDLQDIFEAMLGFLLNLTLWTRLDRIDGVSDLVWADDRAIAGTISGFFKGLQQKAATESLIEPLSVCFREYLSYLSESDLYDVSIGLVNSYPSKAPELPLIKKHLKNHIFQLYSALTNRKN